MNEKVTVIIPFYNPDSSFEKCIQSVLIQTYKNLEILLIDDGSDSNCVEKIRFFLSDKRIKLIRNNHKGAGEARNLGLYFATGKYVCFLDSDDFFEANFIEIMIDTAERNCSEIVASEFYLFDHKIEKDISCYRYSSEVQNCITDAKTREQIFQQFTPNVWDKFFRLDYLRKKNIQFQNLSTCNDLTFTYLAVAEAIKISIVKIPLIHYRINQETNISSNRGKYAKNVCHALAFLEVKLIEKQLINLLNNSFTLLAWRLVRHELIKCSLYQSCKLFVSMITILPKRLVLAIFAVSVLDTFGLIFKINREWIKKVNL